MLRMVFILVVDMAKRAKEYLLKYKQNVQKSVNLEFYSSCFSFTLYPFNQDQGTVLPVSLL